MIAAPLAWAVPAVAGWRLAGLPKALEQGQVAAMLASCDRGTAVGRRDVAMLILMARLGLRAGEVACLALEDIDWRAGEITVERQGPPQRAAAAARRRRRGDRSYLREGGPSRSRVTGGCSCGSARPTAG